MAYHIVDVHSITPAPANVKTVSGSQVMCFALVSVVSTEHPSFSPSKQIIPLIESDIVAELLGLELSENDHQIKVDWRSVP